MKKLLFVLLFATVSACSAAEPDLDQLTWLQGHWKGDGFGGTSEELWSPPTNGVMMGMFRHHTADGKLNFYEFLTIDAGGLKLKHFNPDMTGWEEKNDYVTFKFDSQSATKIAFKGLTFERIDDNNMQISLRIKQGDNVSTEIFNMRRQEK